MKNTSAVIFCLLNALKTGLRRIIYIKHHTGAPLIYVMATRL